MYQTEFYGSGCKLTLSWDEDQNPANDGNPEENTNLIEKLNELYVNLNKLSTEFVDCMKQRHNVSNIVQTLDYQSNLSFKVEDLKNSGSCSEEVAFLKKEVEKLKNENEHFQSELKFKIVNYETEISDLKQEHELKIRDLENKYAAEMSELRVYFEKNYSEILERDVSSDFHNHNNKIESNSNSDNEIPDHNFQFSNIRFTDVESDTENELQNGMIGKENIGKDLNIIKTTYKNLTRMKDEEIQKLKKDNEKCSEMINTLQKEMSRLMYDKVLDKKVKEIFSSIKEDYEMYIEDLQNGSDTNLALQLDKEKESLKKELKLKLENTLNELDIVREQEIESLSEMVVSSAIKSVYYKEFIKKLVEEKESLLNQIDDLRQKTDFRNKEIQVLKNNIVEGLRLMPLNDEELKTDKIVEELSKMKKIHNNEISKMNADTLILKQKIQDLQQQISSRSNCREKILADLVKEITDLIAKEQLDECVTWPSELSSLEQLFARRYSARNSLMKSVAFDQGEVSGLDCSQNSLDLNQILEQRNGLNKVNVALRRVIYMFTQYLTNGERELNDKVEKLNKYFGCSSETCKSNLDATLAANDEEKYFDGNLTRREENAEVTNDRSITIVEDDLISCVEILWKEAFEVLNLILARKGDENEAKLSQTVAIQTDLPGEEIEFLQRELEIITRDVTSIKENICSESIEGYGEASDSLPFKDKILNKTNLTAHEEELESASDGVHESEDYCINCDRIKEQARKALEDLVSQLQASDNKRRSNEQFIERQTAEREYEREESDKKIKLLEEQVKEKEKEVHNKKKLEMELFNLELHVKEISDDLERCRATKEIIETKFKSADNKIWQLREHNQDLEVKLAQKSELADQCEIKLKSKETELQELQKEYQNFMQQLDSWSEGDNKQLEELSDTHVTSSALIEQMKNELLEIEKLVNTRTRELEYTYLPVVPNSVMSSPSEDISVCDRISECLRLISSNESDPSSSPKRVNVPINLLSCLHEKLKKLFRAEEAAFKKIQDQDIQLNKQNDLIAKLELERDTVSENLRNTSDRLAQTKIDLNNWQHGHHSFQSDIQLRLTEKIKSLECQIEHYKKYLTQKDYTESELTKIIKNLKDYISSSENEFTNKNEKTDQIVDMLQEELKVLRQEKKELKLLMCGQGEFAPSRDRSSYKTVSFGEKTSSMSEREGSYNSKKSHVSFADNLESYIDSDISRRAAVAEISSIPRIVSTDSSADKPLLQSSDNFSSPNVSVLKVPKVDIDPVTLSTMKGTENNDSINISLNALTSTKNFSDNQASSLREDVDSDNSNGDLKDQLQAIKICLENEKRSHLTVASKLRIANSTWQKEKKSWRELEYELRKKKKTLEEDLKKVKDELNLYKSQCQQYEEQILSLSDNLKASNEQVDTLKNQLNQVDKRIDCERKQEKEECKKSEEYCKAVVKERIEAEKKCEEYSKSMKQIKESLQAEKASAAKLQEAMQNLDEALKCANVNLTREEEHVKTLTRLNDELKSELDELKERKNSKCFENRTGSLRNLTEKVQKEVALAVELDEYMCKSLESTSTSSSVLNELLRICPTLSPELKRILLKVLHDGCETLTVEEKEVFIESCNLLDSEPVIRYRQQEEVNKQLQCAIEGEIKSKERLIEEKSRMETVLNYYDEKVSFLVTKCDEYRRRYVKNEIELTSERCSRKQLEVYVEKIKKEVTEVKYQSSKLIEEYVEQQGIMVRSNSELKLEVETLKNLLEAMKIELNSLKPHHQDSAKSPSMLNHSLVPLVMKLNDLQDKYSKVKTDYEKKKLELHAVKARLKLELSSNQKLEDRFKTALNENGELEKQLVDMKCKLDELTWQKLKVDTKLKAAELVEAKRRKLRASVEGSSRRENDVASKEMQQSECEKLRQNLTKIEEIFASLYYSWKKICEEMQVVFNRMMTAEHHQRALVYQKNYFVIQAGLYENRISTIVENISDSSNRSLINDVYFNKSSIFITPFMKFKSAAVCILSCSRLRVLVERRRRHNRSKMFDYLDQKLPGVKLYPMFDFILDANVDFLRDSLIRRNADAEPSEPDEEREFLLVDDSLKAVYQQLKNLRKTYVS